jgi:hypothetical protein
VPLDIVVTNDPVIVNARPVLTIFLLAVVGEIVTTPGVRDVSEIVIIFEVATLKELAGLLVPR